MTKSHGEWNGLLVILTITWTVKRYDCCEAVNSMRWSTHYKATQVSSWILTSCQPHSVTSGLIMHYIKIPSHQLWTRHQITSRQLYHSSRRTSVNSKSNQVEKGQQQVKTTTTNQKRHQKEEEQEEEDLQSTDTCPCCSSMLTVLVKSTHTNTNTHTHTHKNGGGGGEHTHTKRVGLGGGAHVGHRTNNTEFHILSSMIWNSRSKCWKKQASS